MRRFANKAAHILADWGCRFDSPRFWVEEMPPEMEEVINPALWRDIGKENGESELAETEKKTVKSCFR